MQSNLTFRGRRAWTRGIDPLSVSRMVVALCRSAIAVTGIHWLAGGATPAFLVAAAALLLTLLPALIRHSPDLRAATAAVTATLLAMHIVLGMQFGLYASSTLYDKLVHVVCSAAIAGWLLVVAINFCRLQHIALPLKILALIVFAGTLSAGAAWEIFEFAVDRTGYFFAQRGLHDTMIDLLADSLGALLALSAFAAMNHFRPHTFL